MAFYPFYLFLFKIFIEVGKYFFLYTFLNSLQKSTIIQNWEKVIIVSETMSHPLINIIRLIFVGFYLPFGNDKCYFSLTICYSFTDTSHSSRQFFLPMSCVRLVSNWTARCETILWDYALIVSILFTWR